MGLIIIQPPDSGTPGGTDGPVAAYAQELLSNMEATDDLELRLARVAQLVEAITIGDTLQQQLTIVVEVTDDAAIDDSVSLTTQLIAELADAVRVYGLFKTELLGVDGLPLPSETASWVMNTEAAQPISEYNNYKFSSMASFKGQAYGTTDAGLYTLSGSDDVGSEITGELATMMLDMGSSRMKRIRSAYLGYTAENKLVLKVRSVSDNVLTEHWFEARDIDASAAPREGYVRLSQGLKSRYWQFELTNINGADFEVDQLELHPLFLGRRI